MSDRWFGRFYIYGHQQNLPLDIVVAASCRNRLSGQVICRHGRRVSLKIHRLTRHYPVRETAYR
jgi:hypothetical protein